VFKNEVKLKVNVITSRDSAEIFRLHAAMSKGASFDSILYTRPEFENQDSSGMEISFGQMEEYIEDSLYHLLPGAFSAPIKNKAAWLIFKLQERKQNIADASDRNKAMSQVKKILNEREANKLYGKFYDKFFLGRKVEANGLIIWSIIEKASDILIQKRKNPEFNKTENIYLTAEDIALIEKQLGADTLKMEVLQVNGRSLKVKDLLENLRFDGFYTNKFEPKIIAAKLNARVKYFIEHEMLTDEAYGKGLQNLTEVKQDIDMWKMSYLGQIMKFKYKDSIAISNDDLYNYYLEKQKIKNNNVTQVNIREILTDSLEVIERVLNELKAGKDFAELAKIYTKRTWTREKGGEFGFFPVSVYGEIGAAAEKMQKGEIYGPIKLPEGYSLFKLIDRKSEEDTVKKSFEEAKGDLKKEVFSQKFQDALVKKTTELAEKYGVSINAKAFKDLKVNNLNMYTFRYMGFGGKINAVPLPMPLYEWYDKYKQGKKDLP
jgi:parvulin-like peptidyl-prolyl isomerase